MNILQEIAAHTRERVAAQKRITPPEQMMGLARALPVVGFPFEAALRSDDIALICEIKRASPSKGVIAEEFPYLAIARDYEAAGAAAISVLTEPRWFGGDDRYLREIADAVALPLLRKDFVVDPYMIDQAKTLGASAVLLICALTGPKTLAEYVGIADELGLSALVETHNDDEVRIALDSGARVIGVNNRDLGTFDVDLTLSERLLPLVPPDVLFVAESGIQTADDVARLRAIGVDAVLIGETIMRSADKTAAIRALRGAAGPSGMDRPHRSVG